MGFDLTSLNSEQIKPVLDTEGAVLVTAGAGSGKTRLLTHRIAHLIINKNISPFNILAITFTNKAAEEMRNRLQAMVEYSKGLWVSTFHSMCASILRKFIEKIGYTSNFSIYGENEKERLIKTIVKDMQADEDIIKPCIYSISAAKNIGATPDEYAEAHKYTENIEEITEVFEKYEQELKKNNALDFDDLLVKTYQLLVSDPEAGEYYSEKFQYIHVDEFQDTNIIQYKLVKALAKKHKNVLVVGDEDQSIYGWRGANISNIYDFQKDFNCKIYKLEQNYRSTKKILNLANKLIINNNSRMEKTLWTENGEGAGVETFIASAEGNEADFVVSKINELVLNEHYAYSDIAVLMRINALTRSFEERFIQYGIPHLIFGGFKFYERKEIKDILAYFRIIVNPDDEDAIKRVINFPKRGIGESTVAQLINYAYVKNITLFEVITNIEKNQDLPNAVIKKVMPFTAVLTVLINQKDQIRLSDFIKYLIRLLNLKEVFAAENEENENRKQNIKELVGAVEQYEKLNPEADLEDYLQNVSLYSELDTTIDNDSGSVNIATVHSAKGLEFKAVFIVGLEEGVFPITRAMESSSDMEEERRLMYVAITRAEERLFLTYSRTRFLYSERKYTMPSRFLGELGYTMPDTFSKKYSAYDYYNQNKSRSYYSGADVKSPPPPPVPEPAKVSAQNFNKYTKGAKVRHKKFGVGIILNVTDEYDNSYAEIEFDTIGKLVLALNYAPLEIIE